MGVKIQHPFTLHLFFCLCFASEAQHRAARLPVWHTGAWGWALWQGDMPTRTECYYEGIVLWGCHYHREFITRSDDDNGLCCKWLWISIILASAAFSTGVSKKGHFQPSWGGATLLLLLMRFSLGERQWTLHCGHWHSIPQPRLQKEK